MSEDGGSQDAPLPDDTQTVASSEFVNNNAIPKSEAKDEIPETTLKQETTEIKSEIPADQHLEVEDVAAQFEDFGDEDFGGEAFEDLETDDEEIVKKPRKKDRKKKAQKEKKKKKQREATDSDDEQIVHKRQKNVYHSDSDDNTVVIRKQKKTDDETNEKKAHFEDDKYHITTPEVAIPNTRGLKKCALRCGLPGKFFSIGEQNTFRSIRTEASKNAYLTARNIAMFLWDRCPTERLYVNTLKQVPQLKHFKDLVPVFNYLEETGVINVGVPSERFDAIPNGKSVTIVGAGLSGLVAAQQLRRAGFKVTVLEGWSDVGGRCRNARVGNDLFVSLGPQKDFDLPNMVMEHFEELAGVKQTNTQDEGLDEDRPTESNLVPLTASLDNIGGDVSQTGSQDTDASTAERAAELDREPTDPQQVLLYTLLRQAGVSDSWFYDIKNQQVNSASEVSQLFIFDPDGRYVDFVEAADSIDQAGVALESFVSEHVGEDDTYEPCISFLDSTDETLRASAAQLISTWEQQTHSRIDKVGRLSVDRSNRREQLHNTVPTLIQPSWYDICKNLSTNIDIRTNTVVTSIKDTGDKVIVTSSEGSTFESDFCMVTVPIGVLKNKTINFEPELPPEKEEAITKIGAGRRNTLVIPFKEAWWQGQHFKEDILESGEFIIQSTDPNLRGIGSSGKFQVEPSPHIIFALAGQSAEIAEDTGGEMMIVEAAMQHLRKTFPKCDIPEPDKSTVSNWGTDPLSLCSAPFCKPETKIEHFTTLAKPVGRLSFAGDATDPDCYGMLLGAAHSGIRAARDVIIKNRTLTESGQGARPKLTPQQRAVQIAMMGAAPAIMSKEKAEQSPGKDKKLKSIGIDFDIGGSKATQRSLGSSTNLAAKYAKMDRIPYMQRSLFNSKREGGEADVLDRTRAGVHNVGHARQLVAGQASLARLERVTDQRMKHQKERKKRDLALTILEKDDILSQGTRSSYYQNSNSVDDATPIWYYQNNRQRVGGREFAKTFYSRNKTDAKESAHQKKVYTAKMNSLVSAILKTHAVPQLAEEAGQEIKIYSAATFKRLRDRLTESIIDMFKNRRMGKLKSTVFRDSDWGSLPDLSNKSVQAAIKTQIDKVMTSFVDKDKEEVVGELGYDPATQFEDVTRSQEQTQPSQDQIVSPPGNTQEDYNPEENPQADVDFGVLEDDYGDVPSALYSARTGFDT